MGVGIVIVGKTVLLRQAVEVWHCGTADDAGVTVIFLH
jgi:hypothetical protein